MTILGTKKFWMPSPDSTDNQSQGQILKNSGYINIQLFSVNYKSNGNFWQNIFGGFDNIVLSTNIRYQTTTENIEATSIQDVRKVDANKTCNLGLQRNIAIKVPANADALELTVKVTAVKDDTLQAKFNMLNGPEFQAALQLAPTVVGQVLTITSLAKKLFTESDPSTQLEATYAGILSSEKDVSPVSNGKLTRGYLLLISTDDGSSFTHADESKFSIKGDSLYYDATVVENTYVVFSISFDRYKGSDEKSLWFRRYAEALNHLDRILTVGDPSEAVKIYTESKNIWIEGNALLEADATYLYGERTKIKTSILSVLNEKYTGLAPAPMRGPAEEVLGLTPEMLKQIAGPATLASMKRVLPSTALYLEKHFDIDPDTPLTEERWSQVGISPSSTLAALGSDTRSYLQELEADGKNLKLVS